MEYRSLGKTGLKVSTVGIGCWQMGGVVGDRGWTGVTDAESIATIQHAETLGVNFLDTAEKYGRGRSEKVIGEALKDRRNRYVIATKVDPISKDSNAIRVSERILSACEGSLKRLKTDYIDVYQLHHEPHIEAMELAIETLEGLKQKGKIRWYGISCDEVNPVRDLLRFGDITTLQFGYNLLNRTCSNSLELAKNTNLGTLIKIPLASGLLSGKYFDIQPHLDDVDPRKSRFSSVGALEALIELSNLRFLTGKGDRTMVQAALRFVLDTDGVTTVIPGAKNRQQLEENAGAMTVSQLSDEELTLALQIADRAKIKAPKTLTAFY